MDDRKVDVHLVVTALQLARREALHLLGLASIHAEPNDLEIQDRIFSQALDIIVPYASHSRRLIELICLQSSENLSLPFEISEEVEGGSQASYPSDLKVALDLIIHSRTIKGTFAKIREKVTQYASDDVWSMMAKADIADQMGHETLGSPGFNPWRYSLLLYIETDHKPQHTIPALALAKAFFEVIEPRAQKAFGEKIAQWSVWDII